MVDNKIIFFEQERTNENNIRELKNTKIKLNKLKEENKIIKEKLQNTKKNYLKRTIKHISILSLVISIFLFSTKITGYIIANSSIINQSKIGIILFIFGLIGFYIFKKNY
jgi:hypothetical protein